jgi:hypothetical protein
MIMMYENVWNESRENLARPSLRRLVFVPSGEDGFVNRVMRGLELISTDITFCYHRSFSYKRSIETGGVWQLSAESVKNMGIYFTLYHQAQ